MSVSDERVSEVDPMTVGQQTMAEPLGRVTELRGDAVHPVQHVQRQWLCSKLENTAALHKQAFGSSAANDFMSMVSVGVAASTRGPGLPSNNLLLDFALGLDETIGFEDYLDLPENRPDSNLAPVDMHTVFQNSDGGSIL
ncbi:MAG: hypothetical protein MHM6MM_002886 [Cercozoa sp. M6MM]